MESLDLLSKHAYFLGAMTMLVITGLALWLIISMLNDIESKREAKEADDFARHLEEIVRTEQYAVCPEAERKRALEEVAEINRQIERQLKFDATRDREPQRATR